MRDNENLYSCFEVAAGYARQSHLQPPEQTILRELQPYLTTARMLDLGVGGGRTTVHFANLVRDYVGTDYSEAMIQECRKRLSDCRSHVSFEVCDARSMGTFKTGSFDFVLFSHNGIDYVNHEDRLQILKEIRRVGQPGGFFCFSSHNLNAALSLFELRHLLRANAGWGTRAKRLVLRFVFNWNVRTSAIRRAPYAILNDGAHHRKLRTYYIRPLEQIAQLERDFTGTRVFSLDSGAEIKERGVLQTIEDPWLYYLCNFKD